MKAGTCRFLSAFLVLLISGMPSSLADIVERDVGQVREEIAAQQRKAIAEEEAEEKKAVEGFRIRFEQVMDDPDNPELNLAYARQQIADGNVLGAAGTLERILMLYPELVQVRLLYAIVLYRLDNLAEAERELKTILEYEMPDSLRADVDRYLKRVRQRRKATRIILRQTVGWEMDDNRNASPSSKRQLVSDVPVGVTGSSGKQRDTSFLNITNVEAIHNPGFQAGHEVFGSFTYYLQEQATLDTLDIQSFRGDAGMRLKHPWVNVSPSFFFSHLFLSRESFLRSQGFQVTLDREVTKRFSVDSTFAYEYQDYMNIAENTTSTERKGPQVSVDFNGTLLIGSKMRATLGAGYLNKNAKQEFNAYERLELNASHLWLLGHGQYLLQSVEIGFDYYDEPEVAIAGRHRRDKSLRYRATYGVPVRLLAIDKLLPRFMDRVLDNMTMNLTYEYYRSLSTITNFTYRNNKFQVLLTKTIEF